MATPGFFLFAIRILYNEGNQVSEASFAQRIYRQREDMNLSLRDLARVTGVSASTISRIENGHLSPTLDIVEKLTTALRLTSPAANLNPNVTQVDARSFRIDQENTYESPVQVVIYRKLGSTTLRKGTRRDLSRIAARNGYEVAVVMKGTCQLRTNNGFRENLRPGATINCKLIAKHTYFAIAVEEAELLWIG